MNPGNLPCNQRGSVKLGAKAGPPHRVGAPLRLGHNFVKRFFRRIEMVLTLLALVVWLLAGCTAPIGANRVPPRSSYAQSEANILRSGEFSAYTLVAVHRYGFGELAARHPDQAVRAIHQKAVASGERDLLFALAELSYAAGDEIRASLKPWEPRDARDFYLGSAVYAWLYLFGDSKQSPPGPFDRRFRDACDLYNSSLALALGDRNGTNALVHLEGGHRHLPVGQIDVKLDLSHVQAGVEDFEQILSVDQFRVHGMSVLNRDPGVGAPLICAKPLDRELQIRPTTPATVFLRGPASLANLTTASTNCTCTLELYSPYDDTRVAIGGSKVPLEFDLTTFRAYMLNQSRVWALGRLGFLAPAEQIKNRLLLSQPYEADRIPVVFVHGTFSSPVTWAEMANTLIADPFIRSHYQLWSFMYASGNQLAQSVADLRDALTQEVKKHDPEGTNVFLRQMVVIGHSQGGLLTKGTAVDTGDAISRLFFTNKLENLKISPKDREQLQRLMVWKPLPFVRRVVFIATPHRGSYLSGSFARRLAAKFVALPRALVSNTGDLLKLASGSEGAQFLGNRIPTSLDGMSPKNPALKAMAGIPVLPPIKANSIIPISKGDPQHNGRDGVVAYSSAHLDDVESELIVPWSHTCLDQPATIEEVRRILHEHLKGVEAEGGRPSAFGGSLESVIAQGHALDTAK